MPELPSIQPEHGGTIITIKEYVDTRLHASEEMLDQKITSLEKKIDTAISNQATALLKAESATEYRLEGMNEFRKTVEDQSNKQATKTELDSLRETFYAEIKAVRDAYDAKIEGIRIAADNENKTMWKVIYGLAAAVAVIEAILKISPIK